MIQSMVKLLGSVTSFKAKKDRTTQHTTQQKNKNPENIGLSGYICGETGTRTFWGHLVIFGEIVCLWGQYNTISLHLPNINNPAHNPDEISIGNTKIRSDHNQD